MLFKEFWELVDELAPGEEVPIKTSVEGNVLTVAIVGINTSTLELGYYSPDGDYVAEGDVSRSDSGKTTICPRFVETNSSWYYTIEQNQYDNLEDMPNVSCRQQLLDLAKVLEDKYGIIKEDKEEDNEMEENREEQEIELDNGAEMLEEELKEDIRDNFSDEGKSDEVEDPRIVGFQTTLETLCNYIESVNARLTKIEEMLEKDLKKKKKAAKKKAAKAEKKESKKKEAKKEKEKKESKKDSKKKGNKKK